jgi:uncharacterized protein (TIGR03435 family)
MRYLLLATLLLGLFDFAQGGQAMPKFDVTSVKPNAGTQDFVRFDPQPGGRLSITNASLRMVMGWAYGVQDSQLSGGADWVGRDRFDFLAKAEGNPTTSEMRQMLRALLVDHFKLTFHEETRELPVYSLSRLHDDKLGPKLAISADTKCGAPADADARARRCEFDVRWANVHGHGIPMELLLTTLAGFTARPVIDRTGLKVPMDFDLTWGVDANGPSIFTAVEEQLGLKLEPTRAPVGILVIDRAEKPRED